MKKLVFTLALAVGLSSIVNAQYFVTSFGVELGWNLPNRVHNVVYNNYYGYDIVHASRVSNFGVRYFEIILQRGDVFVEVSVRNDGWINRRVVRYNYPLVNHVCGSVCGFHSNYYTTYYNHCNSHFHNGHNHVVYVNNRRPQHVHDNSPGKGHKHGHYKNGRSDHHDSRRSTDVTYTRRDRYQTDVKDHSRVSRTSYENNDRKSAPSRSTSSGRSRGK
ncbi:MAG: hypothetical protein RLO81_03745 [Fulvivirga sp.]|uniref:hypothetical protein n=1 Tax=Fulvivirga sp. TaxID=1931237 RepID=UPI0032F05662